MDLKTLPLTRASIFKPESLRVLEEEALPIFMQSSRWFGGKARLPQLFSFERLIRLDEGDCALAFIEVEYRDSSHERYLLPLEVSRTTEEAERINRELPEAVLARCEDGEVLYDGVHGERFRTALLHLLASGGELEGLTGVRGSAMPAEIDNGLPSSVLKVEQSNSSIIYSEPAGEAGSAGVLFVKLFRKLEPGINPDVEMTRFLAEGCGFAQVPPFAGVLEFGTPGETPQVLALALGLVPNEGDAWTLAQKEVRRFYERVLEAGLGGNDPSTLEQVSGSEPSPILQKLVGTFLRRAAQLGERTGEMHLALASDPDDPDFAPAPFTMSDQRALGAGLRASILRASRMLENDESGLVQQVLADQDELLRRADNIAQNAVRTQKTRTHGDFHLGQVLNTGGDFVMIDFEGEPQRPLAERREKRSPLRDVAGMLRSFHYAAYSVLEELPEEREALEAWAEAWTAVCSAAYLDAWRKTTVSARFIPESGPDLHRLLDAFVLEKAIYEVEYELNNRPDWLPIPLRGILQLLGTPETG